jgi:hypothetical protein
MFANIARRTQTLSAARSWSSTRCRRTRAVPVRDSTTRLGNLATRLRRSSDNLLVVSGTVDQAPAVPDAAA